MNAIRAMVHLSFRGYRTNSGGRRSARRAAGTTPGEIIMPDSEMFTKKFIVDDGVDDEDIDEAASDFQNVGLFDKMYQKEMEIKKDKVKTQIVKRKYFKSSDPPMLTWEEKEQIRLLHKQDPEEWSEDRLCESFPATREVVLKVLRSRWVPKEVKVVTKYDEAVKKNWELYKAGKLPVSPELREHLEKFKNRKIVLMEPAEIAKRIVKEKPVFPKPESTMFSNIIQTYLDENPQSRDDDDAVTNERTANKSLDLITSGDSSANDRRAQKVSARQMKLADAKSRNEPIVFDEFLKQHVENVDRRDMTRVDRVLVDEYKQRKSEAYKAESLAFESDNHVVTTKQPNGESDVAKCLIFESDNPVVTTKQRSGESDGAKRLIFESESPVGTSKEIEETNKRLHKMTFIDSQEDDNHESGNLARIDKSRGKDREKDLIVADKGNLETGIIARQKKNDALNSDYPQYITIPRKKYKRGVSYRIEDRYYDDDGEFLYRVIGLK